MAYTETYPRSYVDHQDRKLGLEVFQFSDRNVFSGAFKSDGSGLASRHLACDWLNSADPRTQKFKST